MTVASRPARFAIITVVRNDRAGLARTHASLRAQTSRDFAWIVIDGGSVDGTQAYLARHARDLAWWRSRLIHTRLRSSRMAAYGLGVVTRRES